MGMKRIALTQGKGAIVDGKYYGGILAVGKWRLSSTGYAIRSLPHRNGKRPTLFMHHLVAKLTGISHRPTIDHINGDKLDNRACNLRPATRQQQVQNRHSARASSGFRGVRRGRHGHGWQARIGFDGRDIYLGQYSTRQAAAAAYNKAASQLFGEFASPN
jgi:hypothetical protein